MRLILFYPFKLFLLVSYQLTPYCTVRQWLKIIICVIIKLIILIIALKSILHIIRFLLHDPIALFERLHIPSQVVVVVVVVIIVVVAVVDSSSSGCCSSGIPGAVFLSHLHDSLFSVV